MEILPCSTVGTLYPFATDEDAESRQVPPLRAAEELLARGAPGGGRVHGGRYPELAGARPGGGLQSGIYNL